MNRLLLSFIICCNLLVSSISAQTPSDAFMMKKKEICFAVPYQYWYCLYSDDRPHDRCWDT